MINSEQTRAVTKSGTGTWDSGRGDAGTWVLGTWGLGTWRRGDAGTRGTQGGGARGCRNSETRGDSRM